MKLNVVTAVTRPENLDVIQESIVAAKRNAPDVELEWHRYEDLDRHHVGGQRPKNIMLGRINDEGWVCVLDDDTTMHPQFLYHVEEATKTDPCATAVVVSQLRTTGVVLHASPGNMRMCEVDAGQVTLRRTLIGTTRIPETYAGDGLWIEMLLNGNPNVHYIDEILSWHNKLSGVDCSETLERMLEGVQ